MSDNLTTKRAMASSSQACGRRRAVGERLALGVACGAVVMFLAGVSRAEPDQATDGADKWQVETVDTSGPGNFTSLKVDKNGNVHVTYVIDDGNVYPLKYA